MGAQSHGNETRKEEAWLVPPETVAGALARPGRVPRWCPPRAWPALLWALIVVALVATVIELAWDPFFSLGVVSSGVALFIGIPLALAVSVALPAPTGRVWLLRCVLAGITTVAAAIMVKETVFGLDSVAGFLLGGLFEEVLFRVGLISLIAALVGPRRGPGIWVGAAVVAAVAFAAAPGHVAQVEALWMIGPFLAWAVLLTWALWRIGDIYSLGLAHACSNMVTMALVYGHAGTVVRTALCAAALVTLVYGGRWAVPDPRAVHKKKGSPQVASGWRRFLDRGQRSRTVGVPEIPAPVTEVS